MTMHEATRRRARALQLLYAIETGGDRAGAAAGVARITRPSPGVLDGARDLAEGVLAQRDELDRLAQAAAENWRIERIGAIERNILRLAIHELLQGITGPKIVLDEAVWLAQRFGGPKAPSFINGVLDRVARDLGRL